MPCSTTSNTPSRAETTYPRASVASSTPNTMAVAGPQYSRTAAHTNSPTNTTKDSKHTYHIPRRPTYTVTPPYCPIELTTITLVRRTGKFLLERSCSRAFIDPTPSVSRPSFFGRQSPSASGLRQKPSLAGVFLLRPAGSSSVQRAFFLRSAGFFGQWASTEAFFGTASGLRQKPSSAGVFFAQQVFFLRSGFFSAWLRLLLLGSPVTRSPRVD